MTAGTIDLDGQDEVDSNGIVGGHAYRYAIPIRPTTVIYDYKFIGWIRSERLREIGQAS